MVKWGYPVCLNGRVLGIETQMGCAKETRKPGLILLEITLARSLGEVSDDFDELDREGQGEARQRMVGIHGYRIVGDLGNHEIHDLTVGRLAL